jgi:hypothetical protein
VTLHDPFDRSHLPLGSTQAECVSIVHDVALVLIALGGPKNLFVAGALLRLLEVGGRLGTLEKMLGIAAPPRSKLTPARVWERLKRKGRRARSGRRTTKDD